MRVIQKNIWKQLALFPILFCGLFFSYTYAADVVSENFSTQTSAGTWSNGSIISVDSNLSYINKWNNSSVIGNYFSGFYYDSFLWYFETDWNNLNQSENVRVIWSTWKCDTWYGYKLWGYAWSSSVWFIDFDYNDDVFVYYCVDTSELEWYAYSSFAWFQNFEWISFDIEVIPTTESEEPQSSSTGTFVNESSTITDEWSIEWNDEVPLVEDPSSKDNNSNFTTDTIQNDLIEFDTKYESLFYIIK